MGGEIPKGGGFCPAYFFVHFNLVLYTVIFLPINCTAVGDTTSLCLVVGATTSAKSLQYVKMVKTLNSYSKIFKLTYPTNIQRILESEGGGGEKRARVSSSNPS